MKKIVAFMSMVVVITFLWMGIVAMIASLSGVWL